LLPAFSSGTSFEETFGLLKKRFIEDTICEKDEPACGKESPPEGFMGIPLDRPAGFGTI